MDSKENSTPPVPDWIRRFTDPSGQYTNIYELVPTEARLYGTESLFHDWDGELLLMAKDFGPRTIVEDRIRNGERAFRHQEWEPSCNRGKRGAKTNRNLYEHASGIAVGKVYGSIMAGLLRNDGKISGSLPKICDDVNTYRMQVLEFTIDHMPNLKAIACLGIDAWRGVCRTLGTRGASSLREYRVSRQPLYLTEKDLHIFLLAHPAFHPGGKDEVQKDWEVLDLHLARPR